MQVRTIVLESGGKEVIKLKHGSYVFRVKLVDLPNEFVEVYRCVSNQCRCIHFDLTDQYGIIEFEDSVEGLATIVYRFIHKGRVFGEIHVIPIVIDASEIIRKTTSLIETLMFARRITIRG